MEPARAKNYRHILVPTDGSPLSRKAARTAAGLARRCGARLTAICVIPEGVPTLFSGAQLYGSGILSPELRAQVQRAAQAALSMAEREARAAGVAYAGLHPLARAPWQGILRAARTRKCDLIVMASHARGALGALALGSETMKVLAHSRVPVLVCR